MSPRRIYLLLPAEKGIQIIWVWRISELIYSETDTLKPTSTTAHRLRTYAPPETLPENIYSFTPLLTPERWQLRMRSIKQMRKKITRFFPG